jgi:hypothetical protein
MELSERTSGASIVEVLEKCIAGDDFELDDDPILGLSKRVFESALRRGTDFMGCVVLKFWLDRIVETGEVWRGLILADWKGKEGVQIAVSLTVGNKAGADKAVAGDLVGKLMALPGKLDSYREGMD